MSKYLTLVLTSQLVAITTVQAAPKVEELQARAAKLERHVALLAAKSIRGAAGDEMRNVGFKV